MCYPLSDTSGFGQVGDGRPIWLGNFNGDGKTDILFHFGGDKTWWLGTHDGNKIQWNLVSNTNGFGDLLDGSHSIWTGDFNADGVYRYTLLL